MAKLTALNVQCPVCLRRPGRPCQGSRIPSASTLGGGWGGPADLQRPHPERIAYARELAAQRQKTQ